jgi:signal peptidase I
VVYWVTFGLWCAAVVGLVVVGRLTFAGARVPSSGISTMGPTIQSGRVLVYQHGASGIVHGDVVMVQAPGGLDVRRLIGLPGDRVTCCDSAGRVDVDGKALVESYLPSGVAPSLVTFAVTLGPGQVWVMADERDVAVDSRSWGPLPMSDIVGRVVAVTAPGALTELKTPETFIADGLAPADNRIDLPLLLLVLVGLAIAAVIVQGTARTIVWGVRRRRRKRRQRQQTAS